MSSVDHAHSAPPMSPLPPAPTSEHSGPLDGWTPAHGDDSPRAVAWRARTALRRADRGLRAIADLGASVEKLNTTITEAGARWGKRLDALSFWLKVALVPVVGAAAVGLAALAWKWLTR